LLHRFVSEDPIGFAAGDPNLYAYVSNSPLNFRDPLGLDPDSWGFWDWLYYAGQIAINVIHAPLYGGVIPTLAHGAPDAAHAIIAVENKKQKHEQALSCSTGGPCEPTENERKEEERRRNPPPGEPGDPGSPPYDPNNNPNGPSSPDPGAPGLPGRKPNQ